MKRVLTFPLSSYLTKDYSTMFFFNTCHFEEDPASLLAAIFHNRMFLMQHALAIPSPPFPLYSFMTVNVNLASQIIFFENLM